MTLRLGSGQAPQTSPPFDGLRAGSGPLSVDTARGNEPVVPLDSTIYTRTSVGKKEGEDCVECGRHFKRYALVLRRRARELVCLKCARKDPRAIVWSKQEGRYVALEGRAAA